jgi:hypothetical protein
MQGAPVAQRIKRDRVCPVLGAAEWTSNDSTSAQLSRQCTLLAVMTHKMMVVLSGLSMANVHRSEIKISECIKAGGVSKGSRYSTELLRLTVG